MCGITPIPLNPLELRAARTLMMVGGSFDPPHDGHVRLPQALRAAAFPDGPCAAAAWLLYVPAAQSPLKPGGPTAPAADRRRMLELALHAVPMARIWTDEIDRAQDRPAPSFTIDTLRRARAWLDAAGAGHVVLRLVLGADQAIDFHRWREPRAILDLAPPMVMGRGGLGGLQTVLEAIRAPGFWSGDELAAWRERIFPLPADVLTVSSTAVRAAIESGGAPSHVDPRVLEYIRAGGLYAPGPAPTP